MRYASFFLLTIAIVLSTGCQKEEKYDHTNLLVPGNAPPPYKGISTVLVGNYVNKLYIDLIGLKPDEIERDAAVDYLEENALSEEARIKVAEDILALDAYHDRLFQVTSDLLLNGMGYDEVQTVYDDNEFVRDFVYQSGDTLLGQYFDFELTKLQAVLDAPNEYKSGAITINEYFRRLSYNLIYDEINMGSENFVKACFENFFKRYPTVDELERSVTMVDGVTSNLMLVTGRSKADFLTIVTENTEFYQGRILDAYRTLLLREPLTDELSDLTSIFLNSSDYKDVQIEIVKTDEYAGFE